MQTKIQKQNPLGFLLKRNLFLGLLNFLVMFFPMAFFGFVTMARLKSDLTYITDPATYLLRAVNTEGIPFNAEIMSILYGALGFLSAMVLFHHLFSRKSAMLEASLPLTRQKAFVLRLLCGGVLLLLPLLLNILLYFVSIVINGFWSYILPQLLVPKFAALFMITLYGFALGVLSTTLTGQFWSSLLAGATIALSLEGLALITGEIATHYLRTLPRETILSATKLYSPVMTLYKGWVSPMTFRWLPGLLAILVFLALSFWLYSIRKTEAAEKVLAFEPLKGIMEGVLGVVGAALLGFLFMSVFGSETGLLVGLILGAAAVFVLCRVIFNLGFSKLLAHWPIALASLLIALTAWGCIRQDVFGYDRYLPSAEALTSVTIHNASEADSQTISFSSPNAVVTALGWTQIMRDASTSIAHGFSYAGSGGHLVEYQIGNQTVTRSYPEDVKAASYPTILRLLETEDFKTSYQSTATSTALIEPSLGISTNFRNVLSDKEAIERFGISLSYSAFNRQSEQKQKALLDAYWQDVADRTAEQWQTKSILTLNVSGSTPGTLPYQESYVYRQLPIYACDTRFLTAVFGDKAQAFIDYASGGYALEDGVKVVYQTYDEETVSDYSARERIPLTSELITDPQQIRELLQNASDQPGSSCYYYQPTDPNSNIFIFWDQDLLEWGVSLATIDYTTLPQSEQHTYRSVLYPVDTPADN
ncbi:MAG: hypothetical protein PHI98_04895 [Eubacteriales bacterium]|nr:hypothetical protein [Eubacteriales bacterium]